MPLILYQDRLQRILTEIDPAPLQPASPLDVQQVTVSVHTRAIIRDGSAQRANATPEGTQINANQDQAETASTSVAHTEVVNAERTGEFTLL
ncbi:hypothetical protein TELCIR_23020 [Teladorsagia circumcincta]|uniref:Uncharacterized protein n=1 Tax=Teladorsagia circumcincta TaxID=45464 RepID=A0A2G9TDH0_TELCI|nr:hypothetical protein TELCIR_23020 [Teladorsagia circumcincta]